MLLYVLYTVFGVVALLAFNLLVERYATKQDFNPRQCQLFYRIVNVTVLLLLFSATLEGTMLS
ncbi:hypothetical protein BMT55_11125 [Listeria newyorkensis]|uniref:Uncharacterized protein n=1 Tax=Listeria newyorkensis TaxID=1497681 RepID=A0ABX4XKB3_9LIST|nr:hypothetical protein [Listeria newyorkensis]KGL45905.1 hypothetical protein EP56_03325 [Listeriaceae bacterium FSL A5-0209]RQW65544.1 hypothetical protein DUK53_15870 [Listeria sp. SHR_NRA_18]KGL43185.1 hypothetical protein EP58_08625 [Listeria newyorkensis]KMT62740.1 hypothetical protein X559_0893 [Listeria newyorkensis]PNP90939.1 hypothetical protein BMT55_11125 [Listeria newyorkensis]